MLNTAKKGGSDAREVDVTPPKGADAIVDVGREQIAETSPGHHETQDLGPMRLCKSLGDKRDRDHQLGAGTEPGDEAEQPELPDFVAKTLQGCKHAINQDAKRQSPHPAEIVGDDAEEKAAECPAEQSDRGQEAANLA